MVRCYNDTNAGKRYYSKLVGDSPELADGLDNSGLKDFDLLMTFLGGLSSMHARDEVSAWDIASSFSYKRKVLDD